MNQTIEQLQQQLAVKVLELTPKNWSQAKASFMGITCFSIMQVTFASDAGTLSYPRPDQNVNLPFNELRTEMAKLHDNGHAWYTATFTLTPDGRFKFDFDYDHLPAFDIMPSPDKWLDEFKHYPRPELQALIQDWIDGEITYDDDDEVAYAALIKRLKDASAP